MEFLISSISSVKKQKFPRVHKTQPINSKYLSQKSELLLYY